MVYNQHMGAKIFVGTIAFLLVLMFSVLMYGRYLGQVQEEAQKVKEEKSLKEILRIRDQDAYLSGSKSVDQVDLLARIQAWRKKEGLKEFKVDEHLCKYAAIRTKEIFIEGDKMDHGGMKKYYSELLDVYDGFSENLARGWDPDIVLNIWLHSASHEANLRRDRPLTCVKCKGYYCTQLFATPK